MERYDRLNMLLVRFASPVFLVTLTLLPVNAATTQWTDLGGTLGGAMPAVAKNADGRLEAFVRWNDNTLWHISQTTAGSTQWSSSWSSLGGTLTSDPAVGVNTDGTLDVFALGPDSAIWHTKQTAAGSASWTAWSSLGGQGKDYPAVGTNADGRLEVYIHTTDDSLWHVWQQTPGGNWSAGDEIPGEVTRPPAVAQNSDGRLIVFVGDNGNAFWWVIQNTAGADSWSPWFCLLGRLTTPPLVATNSNGTVELFGKRSDNSIWYSSQASPGSYSWSTWSTLGGTIAGNLAVATNANGDVEVFGLGTDNTLWHIAETSPGGAWTSWTSLGNVLENTPAAIVDSGGLLQAFAEGTDSSLRYIGQSSPGVWGGSAVAPSISSSNAVIPVWRGNAAFSSNMYVSIYGSNLSTVTQSWDNAFTGSTAPTTLGGVSVTVNNIPAFIQYVSPGQINIDAPQDSATGPVNIVVQNGAGASNTGTATRALVSPTLLTTPQFTAGSSNYVVAQTPDFSTFIGPVNLVPGTTFAPAKPGDTVIVYGTGCGPTNPPTQAGVLAAQNSPLTMPYQVTIGNTQANVLFAGVVAGTVGLYQFNIVIPNVPAGDQPINLTVNGTSNAQNLLITVGQ